MASEMVLEVPGDSGKAQPSAGRRPRGAAAWFLLVALVYGAIQGINVQFFKGLIPPLAMLTVLLLVLAALWVFRPGPRTYLAGTAGLFIYLALNVPHVADDLVKPVNNEFAYDGITMVVICGAGVIAGLMAFFVARSQGGQRLARLGGPLFAGAIGLALGATYITVMAYAEVAGGPGGGVKNGVQAAPTQAPVTLVAENAVFAQKTLKQTTGTTAIYVVNKDNEMHTFDVDMGGKHYSYPLAAASTTAVVLDARNPGSYTYYCAVSGHRQTMEGHLEVARP